MAVAKSIRQRILEALLARVQAIHGSGFQTNAGHRVYLGVDARLSEEDDMQAEHDSASIEIRLGDIDPPDHQMERLQIELPVTFTVVARASYRQPWMAIESAAADVKRAIELEDRTLGGLVPSDIERGAEGSMPRERGSEVVGYEITYPVLYSEAWGYPESM